ncbi:MAG: aldo/keto reductase [Bacteroidota bacterium]
MQYKPLGHSDLNVSVISFGCMSLPENQEQVNTLLGKAIDKGINFFDTADLYQRGQNEVMVGKALRQMRKDVIIASKVGNQLRADGSGWDWNPSKKYILESIHGTLKRLQTDYLDLYQLHGGTIDDPIDETIEAFEILKEKGLIRQYGISSIRPNVIREYVRRSNICSVMMQYSLLDRRPEKTCFGLLRENKIGVIVRGAVAKGLLISKSADNYLGYDKAQITEARQAIHDLSGAERSPAQTALQFCLAHPAVSTLAVGASHLTQVEENANTPDTPALSEAALAHLISSVPPRQYEKHR